LTPIRRWQSLLAQALVYGIPFLLLSLLVVLPKAFQEGMLGGWLFVEWAILGVANAVIGVGVSTCIWRSPWVSTFLTLLLVTALTALQLSWLSAHASASPDVWLLVSSAVSSGVAFGAAVSCLSRSNR